MARPSDAPDGWWLTILCVTDDDGVVSFREVAPDAGPPPDPPLGRLGPGGERGAVGAHPRGRRPAPDCVSDRSPRPMTRPVRGGPPGRTRRVPVRARRAAAACDPTSSPRPCSPRSAVQSRASTGREPGARVDSHCRCATCSTIFSRSSAVGRPLHVARTPDLRGRLPRVGTRTATTSPTMTTTRRTTSATTARARRGTTERTA